ncbi:uncharacterized protein [Macaca nemestrina]|uniref:uncharacterized protein n=1 Tax=Macaca nemestrina TaxID=9545 RepID=UPI0039B945A1
MPSNTDIFEESRHVADLYFPGSPAIRYGRWGVRRHEGDHFWPSLFPTTHFLWESRAILKPMWVPSAGSLRGQPPSGLKYPPRPATQEKQLSVPPPGLSGLLPNQVSKRHLVFLLSCGISDTADPGPGPRKQHGSASGSEAASLSLKLPEAHSFQLPGDAMLPAHRPRHGWSKPEEDTYPGGVEPDDTNSNCQSQIKKGDFNPRTTKPKPWFKATSCGPVLTNSKAAAAPNTLLAFVMENISLWPRGNPDEQPMAHSTDRAHTQGKKMQNSREGNKDLKRNFNGRETPAIHRGGNVCPMTLNRKSEGKEIKPPLDFCHRNPLKAALCGRLSSSSL